MTGAITGIEGYLVRVEVDLAPGIPAFRTVGLGDTSVREAKDRVRAAIRNSMYTFPNGKITINLSPADVRKHGSAFDLALAVGIVAAAGEANPKRQLGRALLMGELALDGSLRRVRGALPIHRGRDRSEDRRRRGAGHLRCLVIRRAEYSCASWLGCCDREQSRAR